MEEGVRARGNDGFCSVPFEGASPGLSVPDWDSEGAALSAPVRQLEDTAATKRSPPKSKDVGNALSHRQSEDAP